MEGRNRSTERARFAQVGPSSSSISRAKDPRLSDANREKEHATNCDFGVVSRSLFVERRKIARRDARTSEDGVDRRRATRLLNETTNSNVLGPRGTFATFGGGGSVFE